MHRRLIAPLLFLAAALAAAGVHAGIPIPKKADLGDSFVPRPEVARLSSVGFHTALSDYYWLQAVQIVGGSLRPEAQGTVLGRYIDVVTTVDPWVDHPYRFAAVWLTGSAEDVRHANRLLERSFAYHPDEWRNRFYLGFNLFYYLDEPLAAAEWIEAAARMEGSPTYLGGLAARLRAGRAGLDVAEGMIREMWKSTEDPYRRAEYEKMLDEIETERRARALDAAREEYRRRHRRDIEEVADLLRGPRPVLGRLPAEPNDWEWILHPKTGEIVSSFYKHRYRLQHPDGEAREHIYGWSIEEQREAAVQEEEGTQR